MFDRLRSQLIPTSDALLQVAQKNLLKALAGDVTFKSKKSRNGLNYAVFERERNNATSKGTLVLMHGFGSGLGFFFKNYFGLLNSYSKVVAVDWAGMGGSSRALDYWRDASPRVSLSSIAYSAFTGNQQILDDTTVPRSINFFTDSLKETLNEALEGGEPYTLAGHSLGGYLVCHYARKYCNDVNALILISPAGVCDIPAEAKMNEAKPNEVGWGLRGLRMLWNINVTPQQLVRMSGGYGPTMIKNSLTRRFRGKDFDETHMQLMADYLYHISAAGASGEYALNSLLKPFAFFERMENSTLPTVTGGNNGQARLRGGVFAKRPLEKEMANHPFASMSKPVLILYGDNDWLKFDGVDKVVSKWNEYGIPTTLAIIEGAGHHLYLENHEGFQRSIESWRCSNENKTT